MPKIKWEDYHIESTNKPEIIPQNLTGSRFYLPIKLLYPINKIRMKIGIIKFGNWDYAEEWLPQTKIKCPHCKSKIWADVYRNSCYVCKNCVCGVCGSTEFASYRLYEAIIDDVNCANCGWEFQGS